MNLTILEETEDKIILQVEENKCQYCNSNQVWIKGNYTMPVEKKCIKEFFKKEVYLRKIKYICKCCNKTFVIKTFFKDMQDKKFKPFLRILVDKNLITMKELEKNIMEKLGLNEDWFILKETKVLTLINVQTLEIKDFIKVKKNKQIKKEKITEFKEFKRKGR